MTLRHGVIALAIVACGAVAYQQRLTGGSAQQSAAPKAAT
jgi:hypothetical protein